MKSLSALAAFEAASLEARSEANETLSETLPLFLPVLFQPVSKVLGTRENLQKDLQDRRKMGKAIAPKKGARSAKSPESKKYLCVAGELRFENDCAA